MRPFFAPPGEVLRLTSFGGSSVDVGVVAVIVGALVLVALANVKLVLVDRVGWAALARGCDEEIAGCGSTGFNPEGH